MTTLKSSVAELFAEAVHVVNHVLTANRGEGLYGKALKAMDPHLEGHTTEVQVYDEDPGTVVGTFTLQYRQGRFELTQPWSEEHDSRWKVSVAYLRSLVDDPETYVEHPTRLDLDWLADRLPDAARALVS